MATGAEIRRRRRAVGTLSSFAGFTQRRRELGLARRPIVKWTGMFLVGFVIVLGGVLAALWKLGVLARIGTTWTLIGVAIAVGVGIMIAVSNSGAKENIEIQRK